MRRFCFVLLAACGATTRANVDPPAPTVSVAPLPTVSAPSASSSAAVTAPSNDPASRLQATLTRWLDLLAHDDDRAFIEEALTPDELEKVPDLDKLVASFKEDKHDDIVKLFHALRHAKPIIDAHGDRTLVKFTNMHDFQNITFIVDRTTVHIEGH